MSAARVGLDVGSTTAKLVLFEGPEVVRREYRRHHGRPAEVARALLSDTPRAPLFVTGSAASGLAEALGARYVHEIHAAMACVTAHHPRARTVIDLGGQDAKLIDVAPDGASAAEMNERCAAGTGAALDRCLRRLGLESGQLAGLASAQGERPVVSAKCGVFAEADVIALVRAGVARELALTALLDAIVRGNLAVLARGRPLPPQLVLLGGPHAFVPALAGLWRERLSERWRELQVPHGAADDVLVPAHAAFFAAEGAVRAAEQLERVEAARGGARPAERSRPPARHRLRAPVERVEPERAGAPRRAQGAGPLALGLDAGSTTIKAVALDTNDAPVARAYRRSTGAPIEDARAALAELAVALGDDAARVCSLGVTGYAAELLAPVLGADASPVETVAHARSALRYVPEVDVVCDVGGQDIKVLSVAGGAVRAFSLSSQCAAGHGALLDGVAAELGVELDAYAEVASSAARVPELSVGCAVFLDTQRVSLQRDGFTPAEILAAFAAVLPRNVWEHVVAAPSIAALGRVFVLSGGVQRNAAALRAQREYLATRHPAARILVHPFPGEAGAIGAALAGREALAGRPSRFAGFSAVGALSARTRSDGSTRCRRCPSACPRTFTEASFERGPAVRLVSGNACERGDGSRATGGGARGRDLVRAEATLLFRAPRGLGVFSDAGAGLRLSLPRVLAHYRLGPLFLAYFRAIGVAPAHLDTGSFTSEALWRGAAGRGTVDACFPVKAVYAHLAARISRGGFDAVWLPIVPRALTAIRGCEDTAACPVVAGTPMVARAAFGAGPGGALPGGGRLLTPTLRLEEPSVFAEQLLEAVRTIAPRLSREAHEAALAQARQAQRSAEDALEDAGASAIAEAERSRKAAIVMLARPYHADPGLHHGVAAELASRGRTVMSIRSLPKAAHRLGARAEAVDLSGAAPFLTNSGDGEKLGAARVVAAHEYLVAFELSSFKCGQDASLYGAIADVVRAGGRPFLTLHDLDETRPVAALRLRLRTFLDAIERYEERLG